MSMHDDHQEPESIDGLGYETVFTRSPGCCHFSINELGIVGSGNDAQSALNDLERRKTEIVRTMKAAGLWEKFRSGKVSPQYPSSLSMRMSDRIWYRAFANATAVLVVLAIIGSAIVANLTYLRNVSYIFSDSRGQPSISAPLAGLADRLESVPREKLEKIAKDVRRISESLAPIVREVGPILESLTRSKSKQDPSDSSEKRAPGRDNN